MEQMLQVFGKMGWRGAFEKMEAVGLTSDRHTQLCELQQLVRQRIASGRELRRYLKAAAKTTLSPLLTLKQAVLLHLHLQLAPNIKPSTVQDFLAFLLLRCDAIIEVFGESEGSEAWNTGKGFSRSQATTREDEVFQGKEVFLTSKIIRPYLHYLQRFVSSLDDLRSLSRREEAGSAQVWQLVNLLRGVTGMTGHFVMIGRYFLREYGGACVLLLGGLSSDIALYMNWLRGYVQRQNRALCCSTADPAQVHEFVSLLNELATLNEQLMQAYLGKYFFKELRELDQPEWINPNAEEFDTIYRIAQQHASRNAHEAKH